MYICTSNIFIRRKLRNLHLQTVVVTISAFLRDECNESAFFPSLAKIPEMFFCQRNFFSKQNFGSIQATGEEATDLNEHLTLGRPESVSIGRVCMDYFLTRWI
jgi:hypothetical protein